AFALASGSLDAATLVNTRIGTGIYTVQAPAANASGDVLLEFYDSTSTATATFAPLVVPPLSQSVTAGTNVALRVLAVGGGTLSYQWRKNGAILTGETGATLNLGVVQPV